MVHKIAHTFIGVLHLPARWQGWLLDHPVGRDEVTALPPGGVSPCFVPLPLETASDFCTSSTMFSLLAPQPMWLSTLTTTFLCLVPQHRHHPLFFPWAPTPVCEGLPTVWSVCCGSRNTPARCPVSFLGGNRGKAIAGAPQAPAAQEQPSPPSVCQIPPLHLFCHSTFGKGRIKNENNYFKNYIFLSMCRSYSASGEGPVLQGPQGHPAGGVTPSMLSCSPAACTHAHTPLSVAHSHKINTVFTPAPLLPTALRLLCLLCPHHHVCLQHSPTPCWEECSARTPSPPCPPCSLSGCGREHGDGTFLPSAPQTCQTR